MILYGTAGDEAAVNVQCTLLTRAHDPMKCLEQPCVTILSLCRSC